MNNASNNLICSTFFSGIFDAYKFNNEDICHIVGIMYETLMECEEDQVRGYVHFGDAAGVGFPHLTLFTPREAVRIVKNGEVNLKNQRILIPN